MRISGRDEQLQQKSHEAHSFLIFFENVDDAKFAIENEQIENLDYDNLNKIWIFLKERIKKIEVILYALCLLFFREK